MRFQLLAIVLWPNRQELLPKVHHFQPGKVNVITGVSKTGKSAVIPLIDYCLAAGRCSIPIGHIRSKCAWFGILAQLDEYQLLLARKNPGAHEQVGDMLQLQGDRVAIPDFIGEETSGRTTAEKVREFLNEISGTPDLGLDPQQEENYRQRPGFRDLLAFCFQPQNIIANSNSLFFRTDISRYRERLRAVFPFALGALDLTTLQAKWDLEIALRILRRKERELKDQQAVSDRWRAEGQAWLQRALEYGLVPKIERPIEQLSWDSILDYLRAASEDFSVVHTPQPEAMTDISRTLVRLEAQESEVARSLGALRKRSNELDRLSKSFGAYETALSKQKDRLSLSRWLMARQEASRSCPLCKNEMQEPAEDLRSLAERLEEIEGDIEELRSTPPQTVMKEIQRTSTRISEFSAQLETIRRVKLRLATESAEAAREMFQTNEVAKFVGQIKQVLEVFEASKAGSNLDKEVADLRRRVEALRKQASADAILERQKAVLAEIQAKAMTILPRLDAEYPNNAFRIDVDELTLRITDEGGVERLLWEIGSGANWLAYHLATSLALQEQFIEMPFSPVPSLLVLDQPSQVYFPKAARKVDEAGKEDFAWEGDEDTKQVRRIFLALGEEVSRIAGQLQIIVVDHARDDIWGGIEGVVQAAEWRNGQALVPNEWPS